MKIVKLTTDLIELRTNSGIVFESFTSCITTARVICMGATVQIFVEGRYINIEASDVISTQVLPAAEVPFPALGTASDLLALLNSDFFEVCGAGGGSLFPDYPIGSYQTFSNGSGLSATAIIPNLIIGLIVKIEKAVKLDSLSIQVITASAGNAVAGIYKYTDNGTQDGQWVLIEQTNPANEFDLGVASTQNVLLTNEVTLQPYIYAFMLHGNSAAGIRSNTAANDITFAGFDSSLFIGSFRNRVNFNRGLYDPVLPNSIITTLDNGASVPLVAAKVII